MWRPNKKNIIEAGQQEDDTWNELARAFAEDTRSTTWPPRSYTCTFCRREFRSAQALGGHMNVHRHDRARQAQAHVQAQAQSTTNNVSSSSSDSLLKSTNELSLLYQLADLSATSNNFEVIGSFGGNYISCNDNKLNKEEASIEELDLELRLGHIQTSDNGRRLMKKNTDVGVLHLR